MKKIEDRLRDKILEGEIKQSDIEEIMEENDFTEAEYSILVEKFLKEGIVVVEDKEIVAELDEELDYVSGRDIVKQYFDEISLYDVLNSEEERELLLKVKAGEEEAKEQLVLSNLRLVAKLAMKYSKPGIPFLDLVQDGTIGLMKAVEKFDVEKGYKLSTYATWWIKKEIIDSLKEKLNFIKVPNYIFITYQKIKETDKRLTQNYGRKASLKEIAEDLKMNENDVTMIKNAVENKTVTLNVSNSENRDGMEIEDNKTTEDIDKDFEEMNQKFKLSKMLKKLDQRERKIIELYFGLTDDGQRYTFKEIGEKIELSSERVRVLKERALKKLRYVGRKIWEE